MRIPIAVSDLGPRTIQTYRKRSTTGLNGTYTPFLSNPVSSEREWVQTVAGFNKGSSSVVNGTWLCRAYNGKIARETITTPGTVRYKQSTSSSYWKREDYVAALALSSLITDISNTSSSVYNAILSGLILQANAEATLRLKQAKVSYGEALAEARSTINHLATTVVRVIKWIGYARSGQWSRIAKDLGISKKPLRKGIEANWLEYQFGWLPLIQDIYGTIDLLQTKMATEDMVIWARSRVSASVTRGWTNSSWLDPIEITPLLGCSVSLAGRVNDQDKAKLASVGLINPAAVAWAVVPFSFVIDWFAPVGNFLEALTATSGLTFVTGSRTLHVEVDEEVPMPRWTTDNITLREDDVIGSIHYEAVGFSRTVLVSWPIVLPYFNMRPLRTKQLVSASALLAQSLRKK